MTDFPRILVLGATGRLGRLLRAAGDGFAPAGALRWQGRSRPPGATGDWVICDPLADPGALAAAARGCGAVLCLAGVVPGRGAMADNSRLALAAIEAAAGAGARRARVLLASSAAVYGARPGPLSEAVPPAPASEYGRAKAEMEAAGAARAGELGVPLTALRIGNVAGADAALGGWVPGCVMDVFADGRTPRRSYIGPESLARVLGALARTPDLPGVLNLAAPGVVEMGALLDAAGRPWSPRAAPPEALAEVALDVSALAGRVGFAPGESDPREMVAQWRRLQEARAA